MSSTSWLLWTIFVASRSRREPKGPSCVTGTVRGSSLLSGASKMGSLSAPHQVHSARCCSPQQCNQYDRKSSNHITEAFFLVPGIYCVYLLFILFCLSCIGYQGPDFDWADYLKQCEAEAAPQQCFPTVSLYCLYPGRDSNLLYCLRLSERVIVRYCITDNNVDV